jgi:hypothetical protein
MADPADRAAFQTLATVKEEPSDLESEAGDIKVKHRTTKVCWLVQFFKQGCGSGSQLDPDSFGPVDPDPYSESESGSRRAKVTLKSKKCKRFLVLKCWMIIFES